ncbi:MAG TPA: FtsQ-type POTRA domain-containing protein, partial [Rhabdochlamydiaceae bacterium]|nr:FtsQ-type POTRA domain-containing protein [Rhabdochlamydiaceae bacterium]
MNLLKSIALIVGSLYLVTGGTYKMIKTFRDYRQNQQSSKYYLCRILQTGPQKEALKTTYLAELMGISADRPILFSQFDHQGAEKKLLASPVIQEASVKLINPDTVYIDYTVRQPLATLGDFENTVIDENGIPFPISPFFTPK